MNHDKSLECDDCDCECHDWQSEVEEVMFSEHMEPLHPCPENCPWCEADAEASVEARTMFQRIFGGWRK